MDMSVLQGWWGVRDATSWTVIASAVLAGGVLRGMTGFGAALLMAPLLALVASARDTLCLVTLLNALPLTHALAPAMRRQVDHRVLLPMLGAAACGLPCGLWAVQRVPAGHFGLLVGLSVLLSAALMASGWRPRWTPGPAGAALAGLASGLLTGFGGVGGPPAILYLLAIDTDARRLRASFLVYFGCLYPMALACIALGGVLDRALLLQSLLLAPLFHAGGLLGERVYRVLDPRYFRRVVLALLMIIGLLASWPRQAADMVHRTAAVQENPANRSGESPVIRHVIVLNQ